MKNFLLSTSFLLSCVASAFAAGHVATAVGTSPSCNGSCDGSAVAFASGGTGPYGYTWTGPASYTAVGASVSGLCAGTYVVTAIDSSDMSTAVYTLNLTEPAAIVVSAPSYTICQGMSVMLGTSVTGGTPGYSYSWSPTASLSSSTTANPTAFPTTTTNYTVTVTDANGCTETAVSSVMVNPTPAVNPISDITACWNSFVPTTPFGSSTGGGTTYSWTNNNPSIGLASSGAGGALPPFTATNGGTTTLVATITVTANFAGCVSPPTTFTITVNPAMFVNISSVNPASCGMCNGSVTAVGGGGSPPYMYLWTPSSQTTAAANSLCAGTYTVSLYDGNGCTATAIAVVPNASGLTATTSTTPAGCTVCNGSADVTLSGGTGPYSYDWAPGTPAGDATPSISGLCVGDYTVTVTDASGCTATSLASVPVGTPMVATASSTSVVCGSGCVGTITVMESGGTSPYLYDLTGFPQQSTGNFSGVCGGSYVATVTDVNGCSATYPIVVNTTNSSSLSATATIVPESGFTMLDGSIDLTVGGSAPPFTYLWNNGATTEDLYSLSNGTYQVTITDSNGDCATFTYVVNLVAGFGTISGYLYSDLNTNCVFDAGDYPLSGRFVQADWGSGAYWGYTNASGFYSIYAAAGNYTVTPVVTTNLEAGCSSSYSYTLTSGTSFPNTNFAYSYPPIYDVCVSVWSPGIVPGFNGHFTGSLNNIGTVTAVGVYYIVKPAGLTYVGSSPVASSISGDTVFWNYSIPPYSALSYTLNFYTPPSTVLGTPFIAHSHATVTNGTDPTPACNHYVYTRPATGSFDPNAKTVSPSGFGPSGNIALSETEFSYLIQFQNTGSGPAVNIILTDTISSMLDLMSFEMLDASHSYVVEFLPGNVIRWKFDNIMLPDSNSNEPLSHGHVLFRMSKLNAPAYGESIANKAYIYFDFNEAVITNTALNTYSMTAAMEGQANASGSVSVYPNPFSDNATFVIQSETQNESYSFELFDVLGKKIKEQSGISRKQFEISRNGLENGIYFYRISTEEGAIAVGKIIIK